LTGRTHITYANTVAPLSKEILMTQKKFAVLSDLQCSCFSWTMPPKAPCWTHWLQNLGSHTAAWVWVVSQKDWRNQPATGWILSMH